MEECFTVAVAVPKLRANCMTICQFYLPKICKSSINEHRRSRVNVSGVVTPSPVGVAIENDRYPSPPSPQRRHTRSVFHKQRRIHRPPHLGHVANVIRVDNAGMSKNHVRNISPWQLLHRYHELARRAQTASSAPREQRGSFRPVSPNTSSVFSAT